KLLAIEVAVARVALLHDRRQRRLEGGAHLVAVAIVGPRQPDRRGFDPARHVPYDLAMDPLVLLDAGDEGRPQRLRRLGKRAGRPGQAIGDDEARPGGGEDAGAVGLGTVVAPPGEVEIGERDGAADADVGPALADR